MRPTLSLVLSGVLWLPGCMAPKHPLAMPTAEQTGTTGSLQVDLPLAGVRTHPSSGTPDLGPAQAIDLGMIAADEQGPYIGLWAGVDRGGPITPVGLPLGLGVIGGARTELVPTLHANGQLALWPIWGSASASLAWEPSPAFSLTGGAMISGALAPAVINWSFRYWEWDQHWELGPFARTRLVAPFGLGVGVGAYVSKSGSSSAPGPIPMETGVAVQALYIHRGRPR